MKYYYAQCEEKERASIQAKLITEARDIRYVFVDDENSEEAWGKLLSNLEIKDDLYIYSLSYMALDTNDLKKKLIDISDKDIRIITLENVEISVQQILDTIEFTLGKGHYKQKKKQQEGIAKALEDKKAGKGKYGRPRVELPEDFEDNIRLIMARQMSHESYRAKLNLKRSTYFKLVKDLKESWKQRIG